MVRCRCNYRNRIYKYQGQWYAVCGKCQEPGSSPTWRGAMALLESHVNELHHDKADNAVGG